MVRMRRAIIADKTVVLQVVSALFLDEILAKSALKQARLRLRRVAASSRDTAFTAVNNERLRGTGVLTFSFSPFSVKRDC